MLAIRMQRIGRKGLPQYRIVVQDSRRTPNSGRVVSTLGSYDPHAKTVVLDKTKSQTFLDNGAQPSDRVVAVFKKEGVKLPSWVKQPAKAEGKVKKPEKLRKNQPKTEDSDETTE
jgi:small subunit ribosomal protein S16